MENKELALKRIVQRCKENYVNILPHSMSKKPEPPKAKVQKLPPRKQYSKVEIHQLLGQINSIVQLLSQNYLLTKNKQIKSRCYAQIKQFRNRMNKDLDHYDEVIRKRSHKHLCTQKVDYASMLSHRAEVITQLCPQISVYQDPLIPYIFQSIIHSQLFKNQIIQEHEALNIIQRQVPVFNKHFVPIISEDQKTRSKFSKIDDRVLMIGIMRCGYKNSKQIKLIYFPDRSDQQIKNRIKNLCAKQSSHPIRLWRLSQEQQLSDNEMKKLVRIIKQLGPKWKVISRYYDLKSPNFFEFRYNPNSKPLQQPTQLPQINMTSQTFMQRFYKFQQQYRLQMQPQQIYLMNGNVLEDQIISDNEEEWEYDYASMEIEDQNKITGGYKIIDHQIFECDEI